MSNILLLTVLTALISTITIYIDKHVMNLRISRKDYFYYMCLTIIPYSLIMVVIEVLSGNFKFSFSIITMLCLAMSMFLRYIKQHATAGVNKKLEPFENLSYMSLGILLAYFIDIILKIRKFNYIYIIAIAITLIGIFILSDTKLRIKTLQKDLAIKIIGEVALGYIANIILRYWSNGIYILLLNLFLVLAFSRNYNVRYHKKHKNIIKWLFIQQFFGFFYLYFINYLSTISITTSSFVNPITIIFGFVFAFIFKETKRKPNIKDFASLIMIISGVIMINLI